MRGYFTISEFAKLRNININSLRYYEKIGILKPAYTDPKTKYRYYSTEQLCVLDVILMSIDLGVPLKALKQYFGAGGIIEGRKLIEDGKKVLQKHIADMEQKLNRVEQSLHYLDDTQRFSEEQGDYKRVICSRKMIIEPAPSDVTDTDAFEKIAATLYVTAQKAEAYPLLPAGLLLHKENGVSRSFVFLAVSSDATGEKVISLPKSEYRCRQIELCPALDLMRLLQKDFLIEENGTVLVSNLMTNRFTFTERKSEIQKLLH